ncbi:MAG: heavy-metal-associated domain-containing protein [Gemmatimonadaceae bacterium]
MSPMRSDILIDGMLSRHAVQAVYTALSGVPGVIRADARIGHAIVDHAAAVTPDQLANAIELAGCTMVACRPVRRQLPTL